MSLSHVPHEQQEIIPVELESARDIVPLLREQAALTEELTRPTEKVIAALRDAGLFRLEVPVELGGFGADLRAQMAVAVELARGCPSTAWLVGINSTAKQLTLSRFPLVSQDILRADPDVFVSTVGNAQASATRVDGGYRITGSGRFTSGCEVADWVVIWAVALSGSNGQRLVSVLLPASDLKVERTWSTAGMNGTGSHTVVAEDVFVPASHCTVSEFSAEENSFTELPLPQHLLRAIAIELPALVGAAHGAFDLVRHSFDVGRTITDTVYTNIADSPSARQSLAEAKHKIDSAYHHMRVVADQLDSAPTDRPMPLENRLRVRMDMSSAISLSRAAMSKLLDLGGASAFSRSNPLQRLWRDLEVGSRHARFNPYIALEDYGRFLGRGEPPTAVLV